MVFSELLHRNYPPEKQKPVQFVNSETCDERPPIRDRPSMGDGLLMVDVFDIVRYTSDERPPLLKDCFLVAFRVVSHQRFHCTSGRHTSHQSVEGV